MSGAGSRSASPRPGTAAAPVGFRIEVASGAIAIDAADAHLAGCSVAALEACVAAAVGAGRHGSSATLLARAVAEPGREFEADVAGPARPPGGADAWWRASVRAQTDPATGAVRWLVGTLRDVSAELLAVRTLEARLAAIEKSHAVAEFDLDGCLLTANSNFLSMMGYALADVVGRHHSLFVPPPERGRRQYREFWDRLRRGQHDAGRYARLHADGRLVWIQATYNPVFDPAGRPCRIIKYATDITDAMLREADFEGQLNAIGKALCVVEFELDGTIRTANENFLALTGFGLEEIWGRHHRLLVDPEEASSADYAAFWRSLAAGDYIAGQFRRRAKGGREFWIQASYNPILDPGGRPLKVVKYATDITAGKTRELELEGRLAGIDQSHGVAEFDAAGRLIEANALFRQWIGREPGRLDQVCYGDLVDDADGASVAWRTALANGQPTFECRLRTSSNDARFLAWSLSPIRDPGGRVVRVFALCTDVTARKTVEVALRASERQLHDLFELSPVGMVLWSATDGRLLKANAAFRALVDGILPPGTGAAFASLLGPPDLASAHEEGLRREGRFGPADGALTCSGRRVPVQIASVSAVDSQGRAAVWSIVEDNARRKELEAGLSLAARTDPLTGLANRAAFMAALEAALQPTARTARAPLAVLFLDFDRFKRINDAFGHGAGDALLQQVADRLRVTLRHDDVDPAPDTGNVVARFGGDEFAILLLGRAGAGHALAIAERILTALTPSYRFGPHELQSTASIGIVVSDGRRADAAEILRDADVAMYEAKRLGRARAVVFDEAMHVRLARHVSVESALRQALGTSQLSLVYQPIVDLDTGDWQGLEALVRWTHPVLGNVPPNEFIEVAEDSGLIVPLGDWVLNEALRQTAAWSRLAAPALPRAVSINVSRLQLALGDSWLKTVDAALSRHAVPGGTVHLEVTEREIMRDPPAMRALMAALRERDVRLVMDDFGTGTSSLACLRDFPFDAVKIDRSFLSNIEHDRHMLAVLHATVALVRNLGMRSVAEGVERPTQAAILQSIGCASAQGYLFGKPATAKEIEALATGGWRLHAAPAGTAGAAHDARARDAASTEAQRSGRRSA
jgi:diguanylate cyclase (GGDEF)-like protein/PAS domain S-box-containing protein